MEQVALKCRKIDIICHSGSRVPPFTGKPVDPVNGMQVTDYYNN
jgi:hypothetical protein